MFREVKDEKARKAIEQIRHNLGFWGTSWDASFRTDDIVFGEYTKQIKLILRHLNLEYVRESTQKQEAHLRKVESEVKEPAQKPVHTTYEEKYKVKKQCHWCGKRFKGNMGLGIHQHYCKQ